MRALDENFVYDLSELTSEEYRVLFNWLLGNDSGWRIVHFESWKNDNIGFNLKYNGSSWSMQEVKPTHNAKELFYTLENIQVDCSELSEEQIKEMADVFDKNGFNLALDGITEVHFYLRLAECGDSVNLYRLNDTKTTITYEKFMELFGDVKEENFKKLAEVLNEELTEESYKPQYEVKYIAEKPKQYQIGIDTFERCEANMTKEEILACVRFNIDKYNWRNKGQDLEDLEKIISYANWAIKQLKK